MYPYTYEIALRIWHPTIDPSDISSALSIEPRHTAKAGTPRKTPKGALLEGINQESFWYAPLIPEGEATSEGTIFEDYLEHFITELRIHGEFFSKVRSEGGRAELSIGMFSERWFGYEISPKQMLSLAELGLSLSFSIYP